VLVAIMVVLAALVKPQFAVLAVALLAARQWRLGGIAIVGVVISNLAAYLVWPRDFPQTIGQSIHAVLSYGGSLALGGPYNVSFGRGIPDFGYVVLVVVVVSVLVLGRRISPVMTGIALLATAALFPPLVYQTYLVLALPIAALVARDPDGPAGSGIFDRLATLGDRRRAVGICLSLAAALSIAQIALPTPTIAMPIAGQLGAIGIVGTTPIVFTTLPLVPLAWLIACAAIIVSYTRRPVPGAWADASTTSALGEPAAAAASCGNSE